MKYLNGQLGDNWVTCSLFGVLDWLILIVWNGWLVGRVVFSLFK